MRRSFSTSHYSAERSGLVRQALQWSRDLFHAANTPYVAVGGLAARAHGGTRPLLDLDFYVPDASLVGLQELAGPKFVQRDRIRCGDHWDLTLIVLDYAGVRIEVGGADTARYRGTEADQWHPADIAFHESVILDVFGLDIAVLSRADLVQYKGRLMRDVDLIDLHELTGGGGRVQERLAVYGSLAPGHANASVLDSVSGEWQDGVVRGSLHPEGWGATLGYPALRWHPDGDVVPVQLLTASSLPEHWSRLDDFEGDAYRRRTVPVTLTGGHRELANIYVLREDEA